MQTSSSEVRRPTLYERRFVDTPWTVVDLCKLPMWNFSGSEQVYGRGGLGHVSHAIWAESNFRLYIFLSAWPNDTNLVVICTRIELVSRRRPYTIVPPYG
jgi:hypothetical protein